MVVMEFEAKLEQGVIRVPETVADLVGEGAVVRVSITAAASPQPELAPDEAWNSIMAYIRNRMNTVTASEPYTWRREDAYDHLM